MTEGDLLVFAACATPSDTTARLVLADWLQENPFWGELEEKLRGPKGEELVRKVWVEADKLKRKPCLKLLWAVGVFLGERILFPPFEDWKTGGYLPGASGVVPTHDIFLGKPNG